jgi:hypothetical protein
MQMKIDLQVAATEGEERPPFFSSSISLQLQGEGRAPDEAPLLISCGLWSVNKVTRPLPPSA